LLNELARLGQQASQQRLDRKPLTAQKRLTEKALWRGDMDVREPSPAFREASTSRVVESMSFFLELCGFTCCSFNATQSEPARSCCWSSFDMRSGLAFGFNRTDLIGRPLNSNPLAGPPAKPESHAEVATTVLQCAVALRHLFEKTQEET
jgi:hypothetical protein